MDGMRHDGSYRGFDIYEVNKAPGYEGTYWVADQNGKRASTPMTSKQELIESIDYYFAHPEQHTGEPKWKEGE